MHAERTLERKWAGIIVFFDGSCIRKITAITAAGGAITAAAAAAAITITTVSAGAAAAATAAAADAVAAAVTTDATFTISTWCPRMTTGVALYPVLRK